MGLFGDIASGLEDVGGGVSSGLEAAKNAIRSTEKYAWHQAKRGFKENERRILDPLAAMAIQQGAELNRRTVVLDFERLARGENPFVHGRRTYFGEEITPRRIDVGTAMFGSGTDQRRARRNIEATFAEAGPVGEMITKSAVDPLNLFALKTGVVPPLVDAAKGLRAAVRAAPRVGRLSPDVYEQALRGVLHRGGGANLTEEVVDEARGIRRLISPTGSRVDLRLTDEGAHIMDITTVVEGRGEGSVLLGEAVGRVRQANPRATITADLNSEAGVRLFARQPGARFTTRTGEVIPSETAVELAKRGAGPTVELQPSVAGPVDHTVEEFAARAGRAADDMLVEFEQTGKIPDDFRVVMSGAGDTPGEYVNHVESAVNPAKATRALKDEVFSLDRIAKTIMSEERRTQGILASSPLRPLRFVTSRFVGSANTVKAEALEARVALEADKFEQFARAADFTGAMVDEQAKTLGIVSRFDDGVVKLSSGQEATIRELMEQPGKFRLSVEESDLIKTAKEARKQVHDWGLKVLESHFLDEGMPLHEARKAAAEIIRETALEEGVDYWPRMAAALGEEEIALARGNFFRVGAKAPNLQLPRSSEFPGGVVKHSGDIGAVLSRYSQQVFFKVQQETVIKPMLKALSIDAKTLTPVTFRAAVDHALARREWLRQSETLLKQAPGLSGKQLSNRIARMLAADVPEEWKASLSRLLIGDVVEAPTDLVAKTGRAGKGVAETLRAGKGGEKALEKAAEAVETARRTRRGQRQLSQAVSLIRKEFREYSKINIEDLRAARNQLKVAERVAKTGFRRLPENKFPGIAEVFEKHTAEQIEQAFSRLDPQSVPGFLAAVNNWVGVGVGAQAGVADIGFIGLQMLPALPANPAAFASALVRMTDNKAYLASLRAVQADTLRDGRPMLEAMFSTGLRLTNEPIMPEMALVKPGEVAGKAAKLVQEWPLNRTFSRGVNLARISMARTGVRLMEAIKGGNLTDDELRAVMRVANTVTGDFNWTRAGIGQVQRSIERVGVRFAPTWLRANLQWLSVAASPSVSVESNLARLALANTVGAVALLYSASALLLGQTPHLDPRDTRKFMTVTIPGTDIRVGPGGVIVQVVRTFGKAAILAEQAAKGDKEAAQDLVDIREGRNPIRQFWRSGAPVIGGLVYDLTAGGGRQAFTQRKLSLSPEGAQAVAESSLPFPFQDLLQDGPTSAISSFLGGRAFPVSPPELFLEQADRAAKEAGFQNWESVPKATRAQIMRQDADLRDAAAARAEYYERFPDEQSREDFVFGELERSRKSMEDVLLPSWQAVQAGRLSISDFRRRFSDLSAQHAYLSNQLMDGLDENLKKRNNETEQDYYARLFHGIQPEQFDADQDGFTSPSEWEAWREARDNFWREFPQASQYRSYIEVDYPTRFWESPTMAGVHRAKLQMQSLYDQFLQIPKYRGLSAEQGNFLDSVIGLADRKAREIRFALAQRGIDPSKVRVPSTLAWRLVLEDMRQVQLSPDQSNLIRLAIVLDRRPEARRRLLNTGRATFLLEHRNLADWYPSAFQDAGLRDREIALLGLAEAPLGTPTGERLAEAAA